ncbi:hypothetical protein [Paenibacillus sp. FSL K6-1558]|uniref:hypothetical protein n=1 Tax=Paenibacillus sp. FSL K6-1558 TaxID=2921473 RepID=UPI0012B97E2B|nr:hypothetical protein [Paenibacillus xylanexedens]
MHNILKRGRQICRTPILKVGLVLALAAPIILILSADPSAVASPIINVTSGARTAPPPLESQEYFLQSRAAKPVHIYQATCALTRGDGLHAIVKTTTRTFKDMKTLSVNYRLERWTGTAWVMFAGSSSTQTQMNLLRSNSDWEVTSGYYYRVTSVHTADDGMTSDESTHTSPSVLF